MTISKNAAGIVILLLAVFGAEISEAELMEVLTAIGQIAGFALMVWNQIDRPDVSKFLFKTE